MSALPGVSTRAARTDRRVLDVRQIAVGRPGGGARQAAQSLVRVAVPRAQGGRGRRGQDGPGARRVALRPGQGEETVLPDGPRQREDAGPAVREQTARPHRQGDGQDRGQVQEDAGRPPEGATLSFGLS